MISMFYQFAATTSGADRLENWLWIAVIAFVICIIVAIYQTNKKNEEEEKTVNGKNYIKNCGTKITDCDTTFKYWKENVRIFLSIGKRASCLCTNQ